MEKQMEMDKAQFAEQLKNLVELGKKKKNVLEYQEINDFFKGITLNRKPEEPFTGKQHPGTYRKRRKTGR